MRSSVIFPLLICFGVAGVDVRADSVPAVEPVDETPAARAPAKPVVSVVNYSESPSAAEHVPAPAKSVSPAPDRVVAESDPAPAAEWRRAPAPSEKRSVQTHSGYYVNRVRFSIPGGVKIVVKKDWYAKDITLEYPANPYTNWEGVTPLAFAFTHAGTTLEVRHVTPKYLPETVSIRVPSSVEVGS